MKAVVTGMIATYPVGGVAWDYGQYAVGLERLGFDVVYLEDTGGPTYDPAASQYGDDPAYGVDFLGASLAAFSPTLAGRWHFRAADGRTWGLSAEEIADVVAGCDVLVNVSGSCLLRPEYATARRKVLIDTDPGWNHFVNWPRWDRGGGWPGVLSWRAHDAFFTYAERIGQAGCALPELGVAWRPTRPPVVAGLWRPEPPGEAWTTVMTWDNFRRPIEGEGVTYGTKELEFGRIESLPRRVAPPLEIAVGGDTAPRARWRDLGWRVVDSVGVSRTLEEYRAYVQRSRGEISVAKNVYAATRSGWFSCRTTCYLAAGRPAVVQDTGFSERVPVGEGLIAFDDLDGAVAGIAAVEADYDRHAAAARSIAAEVFGSAAVLEPLLEGAGVR